MVRLSFLVFGILVRFAINLQFNARGVVAMANSGKDSESNKSQFFITYSKQPHLDGKHTIFGKVIDGTDSTLDAMERVPVNPKNRPLNEIKLTSVKLPLLVMFIIIYPLTGNNSCQSHSRCYTGRQAIEEVIKFRMAILGRASFRNPRHDRFIVLH